MSYSFFQHMFFLLIAFIVFVTCQQEEGQGDSDTPVCGGFLEFDASSANIKKLIDYSKITVESYTMDMVLKEHTNLAASGYFFVPVYENENFILKIKGPYGMSFEPEQYVFTVDEERDVKTYCSKDINFKFLGFSVEGQISTFGANEGPKGINLALFSKGQKIQNTLTTEHGLFKFKPLYPDGEYVIKPEGNAEMFDAKHNSFTFKILPDKNNFFPKALIIKGYHLTGKVVTDQGEPLENAIIAIYTTNTTLVKDYNCKHKYLTNNDDLLHNQVYPFCLVETAKDGTFKFPNIPFGKFTLHPFIKNDYLTYSLSPDFLDINVKHEDYEIGEPFKVSSFKIYGKVLNAKGNGIPNVTIKIDGQVKAITDKNGVYILDNLLQGNYDLEAQADDMFFEPLTNIQLSPHLKHIQNIVVTDYRLCGKIIIEATDYFSISKRTVVLKDTRTQKEQRTITDQSGKYCFEVKPGSYHIYPVLTQDEKNSDLHLQPESHDLNIVDKPVLDANFYQSKVKLSGKIICTKKCDNDIKIKLISTKNDNARDAVISSDFSFHFDNILSGQYKLAIVKPEWCWEAEDIVVKVQNVDIKDLNFKQTGYSLFYNSQHDIEISWENLETNKKEKVSLPKSKEKICLPQQGKHKISPISCYNFAKKVFDYDTNNTSILEFTPVEYRTKGKIILDDVVISSFKKENITKLSVTLVIDEIDENNKRKPYKKLHTKIENTPENGFYFFTKPNTQFVITPLINDTQITLNTLIFVSKEKKIVIKEECNDDADEMSFTLKKGVIIKGTVTPQLEGIEISAFSNDVLLAKSFTNKKGEYSIGPLLQDENYEIKAEKEGYRIRPKKNKHDFTAEKLSFLKVKVQDKDGNPLQGVFLSLSSADRGFRVNNNTNAEGYFNFIELYSGEYYIKPLLKEYEFDQQQKSITIKGGEHINMTLTAKRVAFSVFGKINNLNKDKVEGLYLQAINKKTNQVQETVIDKNGEYRLKGLTPGEEYFIRVKISAHNIEKALPAQIPILVKKEDVTGIDFVVIQRPKKIDVRAYLNFTDEEDCPLSKIENAFVELTKPDEDDSLIIKTIPVASTCQFIFRKLDKVKYNFRVIKKVPKQQSSVIIERTVDLGDDRDISNGVKTLDLSITKEKKSTDDSLNSINFSPLFLLIMVLSVLKWDYTLKFVNLFIVKPFNVITGLFNKK